MSKKKAACSRRDFLKGAGSVAFGSMITAAGAISNPAEAKAQQRATDIVVPTRSFGKTGAQVSILALGGMFDIPSNQLLLKQALKWGVTYWDTADCYGRGRSEKGFGKFFSRNPQERKHVFLVTKSDERDPEGMSRLLKRSLKRLQTAYIDLYFVHGVDNISELNDQARRWAAKAKAEGKIRFFGFSTHSNMEKCMLAAAELGWIDGIMMKYNYRLMNKPRMREAVEACRQAGIGLTAMKTQADSFFYNVSKENRTARQLNERFLQKGFTKQQAKLKVVWENPHIASICSQMPNMTILMANVSAAAGKVELSQQDKHLLQQYAAQTERHYCAGCTTLCEAELSPKIPVGDILRYLMYARRYGDRTHAGNLYAALPMEIRDHIKHVDYTEAEKRCPHNIAIGSFMRRAAIELA